MIRYGDDIKDDLHARCPQLLSGQWDASHVAATISCCKASHLDNTTTRHSSSADLMSYLH